MITFISASVAFEPNAKRYNQFFTLVLIDGVLKFHHHCKNVPPGVYPVPRNVTYISTGSTADERNDDTHAVLMIREIKCLLGQNHSDWYICVSPDQKIDLISRKDVELMQKL